MDVFDYLKNYGDKTFSMAPFNEIDNQLICVMIYVEFDYLFKKKKSYTLNTLAKQYFKDNDVNIDEVRYFKSALPIFKLMSESKRFKNAKIFNFESYFSEKENTQFAAASIDLGDNTTYIVYRSTDLSMVGWIESFIFTYQYMPSHKLALDYLKNHIEPKKKYRIGGYSKGATLGEYAVLNYPKVIKQIVAFYSNDGPGLNKKILPKDYKKSLEKLKDKFYFIAPEYDFVGTVYPLCKPTAVFKAKGLCLMEHDYTTWIVEDDHFKRGKTSNCTQATFKAMKQFQDKYTSKQKEELVLVGKDICFEVGLSKMEPFKQLRSKLIKIIIFKLPKMKKETKIVRNDLIKVFLIGYKVAIKNYFASKFKFLNNDRI